MNYEQIRQRKLKPRQTMTEEVVWLYDRRAEARKQKDFAEADRLRVLMECLGFDVANEDLWRGGPLR